METQADKVPTEPTQKTQDRILVKGPKKSWKDKAKDKKVSQCSTKSSAQSEKSDGKLRIESTIQETPSLAHVFNYFGKECSTEQWKLSTKADLVNNQCFLSDSMSDKMLDSMRNDIGSKNMIGVFGKAITCKKWKIIPKAMSEVVLATFVRKYDWIKQVLMNSDKITKLKKKGFFKETRKTARSFLSSISEICSQRIESKKIRCSTGSDIEIGTVIDQIKMYRDFSFDEQVSMYKLVEADCNLPTLIPFNRLFRNSIPCESVNKNIGSFGTFLQYMLYGVLDWLKFFIRKSMESVLKSLIDLYTSYSEDCTLRLFYPFMKFDDLCNYMQIEGLCIDDKFASKMKSYLDEYNSQCLGLFKRIVEESENLSNQSSCLGSQASRTNNQEPLDEDTDPQDQDTYETEDEDLGSFLATGNEIINYDPDKEHIRIEGDNLAYELPTISQGKIVIGAKYKQDIDTLLYIGEDILPSMRAESPTQKLFGIDYSLNKEEERTFNRIRRLNDTKAATGFSTKIKRRLKKLRAKEIESFYQRELQKHQEKSSIHDKIKCRLTEEQKSFTKYYWNDRSQLHKLAEADVSKEDGCRIIPSKLYCNPDFDERNKNSCSFLNVAFGTCGLLAEHQIINQWNKPQKGSYLTVRHNALNYLKSSGQILCNAKNSSLNYHSKFLEHIYKTSTLRIRGNKIIGFQSPDSLTLADISEFPLEAMINLDSTIGRLFVVKNYDSISSDPKIVRHTSLDSVFGYTSNSSVQVFERKNNNCCLVTPRQQEIKLNLMKLIKARIKALQSKLEPYLEYKALVERSVRQKQVQVKTSIERGSMKEDQLYCTLVILTGYLGLLKFPFINFEKLFRVKIWCRTHRRVIKGSRIKMPCLCLYNLDRKSIMKSFEEGMKRTEVKKAHICKYFQYLNQEKTYVIRKKYREEFVEYYDNRYLPENEKELIERLLGGPVMLPPECF